MKKDEIKNLLIRSINLDEVYVNNVDKHFWIVAVSSDFIGISQVKKQQMIYRPLMKYILDNYIHAISIKAYSPEEWNHYKNLSTFKLF